MAKTRHVPTSGRGWRNPGEGRFRGSATRWRKPGRSPPPPLPTSQPPTVKSNPRVVSVCTERRRWWMSSTSNPTRDSSRFEADGNYRAGLKRGGTRKFRGAVTRRLAAAIKRNRPYGVELRGHRRPNAIRAGHKYLSDAGQKRRGRGTDKNDYVVVKTTPCQSRDPVKGYARKSRVDLFYVETRWTGHIPNRGLSDGDPRRSWIIEGFDATSSTAR